MKETAMLRCTIAVFTLIIVNTTAHAEDKAKKPLGTWVREAGENKVTFAIKADKITSSIKMQNGDLVVESTYEVTNDGELKAKVTKVEKNEIGAQIEEGHKFSFKYKIADGTMTISDLKVNDNDAEGEP